MLARDTKRSSFVENSNNVMSELLQALQKVRVPAVNGRETNSGFIGQQTSLSVQQSDHSNSSEKLGNGITQTVISGREIPIHGNNIVSAINHRKENGNVIDYNDSVSSDSSSIESSPSVPPPVSTTPPPAPPLPKTPDLTDKPSTPIVPSWTPNRPRKFDLKDNGPNIFAELTSVLQKRFKPDIAEEVPVSVSGSQRTEHYPRIKQVNENIVNGLDIVIVDQSNGPGVQGSFTPVQNKGENTGDIAISGQVNSPKSLGVSGGNQSSPRTDIQHNEPNRVQQSGMVANLIKTYHANKDSGNSESSSHKSSQAKCHKNEIDNTQNSDEALNANTHITGPVTLNGIENSLKEVNNDDRDSFVNKFNRSSVKSVERLGDKNSSAENLESVQKESDNSLANNHETTEVKMASPESVGCSSDEDFVKAVVIHGSLGRSHDPVKGRGKPRSTMTETAIASIILDKAIDSDLDSDVFFEKSLAERSVSVSDQEINRYKEEIFGVKSLKGGNSGQDKDEIQTIKDVLSTSSTPSSVRVKPVTRLSLSETDVTKELHAGSKQTVNEINISRPDVDEKSEDNGDEVSLKPVNMPENVYDDENSAERSEGDDTNESKDNVQLKTVNDSDVSQTRTSRERFSSFSSDTSSFDDNHNSSEDVVVVADVHVSSDEDKVKDNSSLDEDGLESTNEIIGLLDQNLSNQHLSSESTNEKPVEYELGHTGNIYTEGGSLKESSESNNNDLLKLNQNISDNSSLEAESNSDARSEIANEKAESVESIHTSSNQDIDSMTSSSVTTETRDSIASILCEYDVAGFNYDGNHSNRASEDLTTENVQSVNHSGNYNVQEFQSAGDLNFSEEELDISTSDSERHESDISVTGRDRVFNSGQSTPSIQNFTSLRNSIQTDQSERSSQVLEEAEYSTINTQHLLQSTVTSLQQSTMVKQSENQSVSVIHLSTSSPDQPDQPYTRSHRPPVKTPNSLSDSEHVYSHVEEKRDRTLSRSYSEQHNNDVAVMHYGPPPPSIQIVKGNRVVKHVPVKHYVMNDPPVKNQVYHGHGGQRKVFRFQTLSHHPQYHPNVSLSPTREKPIKMTYDLSQRNKNRKGSSNHRGHQRKVFVLPREHVVSPPMNVANRNRHDHQVVQSRPLMAGYGPDILQSNHHGRSVNYTSHDTLTGLPGSRSSPDDVFTQQPVAHQRKPSYTVMTSSSSSFTDSVGQEKIYIDLRKHKGHSRSHKSSNSQNNVTLTKANLSDEHNSSLDRTNSTEIGSSFSADNSHDSLVRLVSINDSVDGNEAILDFNQSKTEYSLSDGVNVRIINERETKVTIHSQHEGSPFLIDVDEGRMPTARGDGLVKGEKDCPTAFVVDARGLRGELGVQVEGPHSIAKCNIDPERDGIYKVTYVPVEVGKYRAIVKWNGKEIPGSPFRPIVLDPRKVSVVGGWQQYMDKNNRVQLNIDEEKRIPFDVSEAGPGLLRAEVKGPRGNIPCYVEERDHKRTVCFTPKDEGDHSIYCYWSDYTLVNAPFHGYAVNKRRSPDPTKVVLSGRGLKEATVHREAEFQIDGSEAGPGRPDVRLVGVKRDIPVRVSSLGNGRYRCLYTPETNGAYLLHIHWNDRQLRGSPFKVHVVGAHYPQKVVVTGEGLKGGVMGRDINVIIDTRKAGPGELTAHCMGPHMVAYCELEDMRDGTYKLNIRPQEPGRHILQIKYGGEHVLGSPYVLRVGAQPDASKVRVSGPGVEHGVLASFQSRFIVETKGAGAGQLTVRIRGPKGAFQVEMLRDSQKDRTIMCRFDPSETGLYQIFVKWSGVDVPGSPFNVYIVDTEADLRHVNQGQIPPQFQPSTLNRSVYNSEYSTWRDDEYRM